MKPLFFLLVLFNVGLALWEWRKMPAGDPIQATTPPAPLLLAEEAIKARRGATLSGMLDRHVDDWQRDEFSRIWNHLQGTGRWQDAAIKLAKLITENWMDQIIGKVVKQIEGRMHSEGFDLGTIIFRFFGPTT